LVRHRVLDTRHVQPGRRQARTGVRQAVGHLMQRAQRPYRVARAANAVRLQVCSLQQRRRIVGDGQQRARQ